jgi:HYDIN/CFA65/VesB-like, Ig-like domain/Abnormal spindle-like microcephaly-assoc'd, ASPM-SPD-2-Hydin/Cep192 domain 4
VTMSTNPQWFDVTANGCLNQILNAGETCVFSVAFEPSILGDVQGTVQIAVAGAPNSFVTVSGSGTAPVVTYSPVAPHDFGNVQIGQTSAQQVITITNTGAEEIQIIQPITSTGDPDFTVEPLSGFACPLNIPLGPGSSCSVRVSVTPSSLGPINGAIAIFYILDPNGSPSGLVTTSYALNATGVQAQVSATPNPLNFGTQVITSPSAPAKVTLTNTGIGPVTINNVTVGGIDAADFTLLYAGANNCFAGFANTLPAGASCDVWVRFAPTAVGVKNAVLQFVINNAPAGVFPLGTYSVQLNGTGTTATTGIAPNFLNFGSQQVGTVSNPATVTITNTSNGGQTLTALVLADPLAPDYLIQNDQCSGAFLAAGASCTLQVFFAPQSAGVLGATIQDGAANTLVTMTGVGVLASISAAPNPVQFGNVEVGTLNAQQTITVTNTGSGPVNILSATETSPAFVIGTNTCTGQTLATNGATCTIQVFFQPTAGGPAATLLDIDYEAGGVTSTYSVALLGSGTVNELDISPVGPYNFGDVVVGQTALATFTVTNNGASNVGPIAAPVVGPTPPFSIVFTTCTGATLSPGQSCVITVQFAPTVPGPAQGLLSVNPVVQLIGNGVSPNGALSVGPPQLSFGPQEIGTQSQAQMVVVSNNGNIPVTLGTVTVPANYVLTNGAGNTCQPGIILDPGASCAFWVAFQPTAPPGAKNGSITVTYSSAALPGGATVGILVHGNAITPNGTVSPLQLDFGYQEVGTMSSPQTVTFTNTGSDIIVIPTVSVTPAGQFTIQSDNCSGASVLPGATCTISVTFLPTIAGSHEAALTVGALPNQSVVTLKGIGVDATISITPLDFDFGFVVVGQTAIHAFTVTNNGSDPVVIPGTLFAGDPSFSQLSEDCSILNPLGPGASCTIVVQFAPTSIGPKNGTMTVNPVVTLHGTGVAPSGALSANPVQLTFGNVQVGSQSTAQQITFTNTGTIPVSLDTIPALAGPNTGDFLLTVAGNTCQIGVALNPGESCSVAVAFRPQGTGNREAWVDLTYHSASVPNGVISVLLRGVGITPVVSVSPNQLSFGNQTLNTASTAKTVVVTNLSNGPLTLGALSVNNTDFQIIGDLCTNATLAAGATCQFSVIFLPVSSPGPKNGQVTIPIAGLSDVHVALSGQALAAQQGGVMLSPSFVNFGYQQVGSPTTPVTVTLTNNGNAVVTVSNVALAGPNTADFGPITHRRNPAPRGVLHSASALPPAGHRPARSGSAVHDGRAG